MATETPTGSAPDFASALAAFTQNLFLPRPNTPAVSNAGMFPSPNSPYNSLSDQILDAFRMSGTMGTRPINPLGGNTAPRFGFKSTIPTLGGGQWGMTAYANGFNPYAGRGNGVFGPPGGAPPGGSPGVPPPGTQPPGGQPPATGAPLPNPGNGVWPTRPTVPNQPPGAGIGTQVLPGTTPRNTSTVGSGVGGISGMVNGGGSPLNKSGLLANAAPYPNTFAVPQNNQTIKTASGKEVPNPFVLTQEQVYYALSGHPDAIRRLSESLGATGGQTMQNGQLTMTPQNQLFHQIVNYYASGGGAFNTGYTPEDAFNAQKSYSLGLGETTFAPQQFAPGLPMFASMEEARRAGYA